MSERSAKLLKRYVAWTIAERERKESVNSLLDGHGFRALPDSIRAQVEANGLRAAQAWWQTLSAKKKGQARAKMLREMRLGSC